ncbi:MAG: hypothetical protein M1602_05690 [Firmicutes bacterium]|nr:hypothetical protein [Bacillota bacterium]
MAGYRYTNLSPEQLRKLKETERSLGITLLAVERDQGIGGVSDAVTRGRLTGVAPEAVGEAPAGDAAGDAADDSDDDSLVSQSRFFDW